MRLRRRHILGAFPQQFDHAEAKMPMGAPESAGAVLKAQKMLGTFFLNAIVQKVARDLHPVGA
ncbi:MAG: hypothetical protein AAGA73_00175 [Pseudomonadota bacterium]